MVFTMLLPWTPKAHAIRTIVASAAVAASCSPANLERPYTDCGFGVSHSSYGVDFVPSNT